MPQHGRVLLPCTKDYLWLSGGRVSTLRQDLKPRMRSFYGFRVGQSVCVHGSGFGRIVAMGEGQFPSDDLVQVDLPRREHHEPSGRVIEWTETRTVHPRHVSSA
jgi:hypothetical protein